MQPSQPSSDWENCIAHRGQGSFDMPKCAELSLRVAGPEMKRVRHVLTVAAREMKRALHALTVYP